MGNDIFTVFIVNKKNMILEYANTFFRYTVNNRNKINKTLSSIIDIYLNVFYLNKSQNFTDLNKYFALQNSKDIILKEVMTSTIKFYQVNNLVEKIEKDKSTIIILSNVIYLAVNLSERILKNNNANIDIVIEQFINKYNSKIRVKSDDDLNNLKQDLISSAKKSVNSWHKALKLFDTTNYTINIKRISEYHRQYEISLTYDIKQLSKYTDREIKLAIDKNITLNHAIILLEQTVIRIIKDYLIGNHENKYFIKLPLEIFEKQKYRKMIDDIFKTTILKKNIVILFEHKDVLNSSKVLKSIKDENFSLALTAVDSLKVKVHSFDHFDYVFISQQLLELFDGYQEIWNAKGISFIIS